ncbi:FAD binding domain-containing protein [Coniochaeta sp. 2T2.1]|nr:FAD binding domain-containing protein [Coniochaeta sp. 2T2.1]
MRSQFAAALLLPLLELASAQTLVVDNAVVTANETTVAPALDVVSADASDAPVDLFPAETAQLTDDVLANLTSLQLSNISLFGFDAPETGNAKRAFSKCKTYPGDFLWPIDLVWTVFDLLTGGALIKTKPFASPCYNNFGNYNAAKCANIDANWSNNSYLSTEDPTAINAVLYEGNTCLPPSLGGSSCSVGGYPSYAIAATAVYQIQLAVNVARNLNLRLVVKNTGHDFNAKSTGYGSLSIWTHKLKSITYISKYSDSTYTGPALKLGAGVQAFEVYAAAKQYGVTVVGGEGQTVGVMGGYIMGGGHSPLSSLYGMGADQALSFEVVTADGRFVTANANTNSDLYWALRGGGGSTYGVVTSVVVKAFPKIPVAITSFALMTGPTVNADAWWAGIRAWFESFPTYTDAGMYSYWSIIPLGGGQFLLNMAPWFAPNMNAAQLKTAMTPWLTKLAALGIDLQPNIQQFDNYYDAWKAGFPLESWGTPNIRQASRLFPRGNFQDATKFNATFNAFRTVVEDGAFIVGVNVAGKPKVGTVPDNGVNPAWRETVFHAIMATIWDPSSTPAQIQAAGDKMSFDWAAKWRAVSPGAGAYLSEADYIEPNFQQSFWGTKYAKLLQIKQKYDPLGVFYAHQTVGSENWKMSENIYGNLPSQNSKLCRV